MKLRRKHITPVGNSNYNYCDCPFMNPTGRGCNALTVMICRKPDAFPCGFYPAEMKRRAKIEAK